VKWHFFFGAVFALIVVTMVIPHAVGLENFTQWGGMYIDGWCHVDLTSAPQADGQTLMTKVLAGSNPPSRLVWFSPMHNTDSCIAWAHSWCGRPSPEGWTVGGAFPFYRQQFVLGSQNVCDLPHQSTFDWFTR
jgi:hypothetical protein